MKTKRVHFEIFRRECRRLHKLWGLQSWALVCLWEELPQGWAGSITANLEGRSFHVRFPKDWPALAPLNRKTIVDSARHEMIHAMIEPFGGLARSRYCSRDELEAAEESLVYRLSAAIWGPDGPARWGQ